MESKEINGSKPTRSRIAFPSFRIFPLSFSFPGDCRMRFSDAPSVYVCFFVLISLFSIFSSLVCFGFLPYACQFLLLEIHLPVYWAIQTKTMRKSLRWNNFWKDVRTSVIYLKMILENFVWKKLTNFGLWVKFVVIIFIFLRCPFSVKEWLKKDVSLS